MKRKEFRSIFAKELELYLHDKISAGYRTKAIRSYLMRFDDFIFSKNIDKPTFTKELESEWIAIRTREASTTHYNRINAVKHFLMHLRLRGYDVIVCQDISHKKTSFQPHIYSESECARYFEMVDSYVNSKNPKDVIQFPVLFRILYCCGTRIGETLAIKKKDVDLVDGIILLKNTKYCKDRYIVVGEDLRELLVEYANKCFYLINNDDYIFSSKNGSKLTTQNVYRKHRLFLERARIPYLGESRGPRLHDWRHHMAVYSYKQMIDAGLDLYVALPILSTFLGHSDIYSTEKYLRLTFQLFPYIEDKFNVKIREIYEVNEHEES